MDKHLITKNITYLCNTIGMLFLVFISAAHATEVKTMSTEADPHYTDGGFFDIHVCNWPGRPLFFLTLWSTTKYDTLTRVEIMAPDGKKFGELDLTKYRLLKIKNKPDKRVFIKQFDIPKGLGNGIYTAKATFKDGKEFIAKDYVIIEAMQRANNTHPAPNEENVPVHSTLKWDPVPGARYYQVFLRDLWLGKTILESKFLQIPELKLPDGLLQSDGLYEWRIHARDVNGHTLLGDFNHGSLTEKMEFSTAQ